MAGPLKKIPFFSGFPKNALLNEIVKVIYFVFLPNLLGPVKVLILAGNSEHVAHA